MYLNDYLNKIMVAWNAQEGEIVARFISLKDYHVNNPNLYKEAPDAAVRQRVVSPLDEIVSAHLRVLYQLMRVDPPNFHEAYRHQTSCIQAVVKLLQQMKEENWILPIMYVASTNLRQLAARCELHMKSSKTGEILEKAAESLMTCFRVCAGDTRSADGETKRLGMLNLVNQLLKVYFRINKLHLCKPLIRAIDGSNLKDSFSLAQRVTYKYFAGRKAMYDSDFKNAEDYLTFAFANCPRRFTKNKRLILIYLTPVKMLLGHMPRKEVLERYNVLQFHDLASAVKEGNVRKFDEAIKLHEMFFINTGVYLIVEKMKILTYRNLCKKVHLILDTHQIDMNAIQTALQFSGVEAVSIDETHCIVANLIYEGRIKGYISYQHNKLVISKQNAFPNMVIA